LARIARSLVAPALEDVTTWHERDLTQSSAERFIFPEIYILTDYMLFLMNNIIDNLRVDEQKMLKNIESTQGRLMSEAVMMALAKKGMNRQEAHELMRRLTLKSEEEMRPFKEILQEDKVVSEKLDKKEIDKTLNPRNYLGTVTSQIDSVVKKTMEERRIRR